ncbi:MAG TPA: hypothetical protein DCR93_38460 [Cytophagales bacterium]|nr:hypothetical protein [Cytophagales bacterium]
MVWTFANGTVTTYVNGVAEATTTGVMGSVNANPGSEVWLGWRGDFKPGRAYQGSLDEVRIFTNALSAADVLALANAAQSSSDCSGARGAEERGLLSVIPAFQVYPNPNQGNFTVQLTELGDYSLTVSNLLGQRVYDRPLASGSTVHTVHLLGVKPGVYWITLISEKGTQLQQLVIE